MEEEKKPKQKQLGKTKRELKARAMMIIKAIVEDGASEREALKSAGYSDTSIITGKAGILKNPVMQRTFAQCLEAAGVTDDVLSEKIRGLINAKEVKHFAYQGKVEDTRKVDALGIQAQAVELACKLKGHIKGPSSGPEVVNNYVDLRSYEIGQINAGPVDNSVIMPVDGDKLLK